MCEPLALHFLLSILLIVEVYPTVRNMIMENKIKINVEIK